jgi:hypothetical protein
MKLSILILSLITGLFSLPALAYIDPGSGSAIMSAIAGLAVALTIAIKSYWYKIKSFFVASKSKPENEEGKEKSE